MKKKLGWIVLAILLVVLIGGASVMYNKYSSEMEKQQLMTADSTQAEIEEEADKTSETSEEETDAEGTAEELVMAPDFTVYDVEGNAVSLSDFVGKPVVVNFWASWCGPCQMEMPDFEEAYKEYGEEVQFLMVNSTWESSAWLGILRRFVSTLAVTISSTGWKSIKVSRSASTWTGGLLSWGFSTPS